MKRISLIFAAAASLLVSACDNPNQVTLPVTRSFDCDVLVIGGGPAGIGAAVCAARHGASTILAERSGYLGGMATNGLVAPFMSSTTPDGNTLLIRGFYEELVDRMVEQGGAIHPLKAEIGSFSAYRDKGHHGLTTFDFECLKRTTEQMCKEAGVKLLYHTLFIKADIATKDGIWKITAKNYIDCTGDGDVAAQAGAPFIYGDGEGGVQATSLFIVLRNIDWKAMDAHNEACKKAGDFEGQFYMREILAAREAGEFPMWRQKIALFQNLDGTATVNMTQTDDVNGLDPEQVTDAEITGREQADYVVKFLRKYVKGCEKCELAQSAENLGVRETRRIVGEYTVTTEDAKNSVKYPDPVFCCANHMDIHRKGYVEYVARNTNDPYYFPYRALLPQNVDNLLCAGRCAAAERPVMAAIRVIPPCFAMGQAAGTAAALAAKNGQSPKQLDPAVLVSTLKSDGVYLPE